jgi:hypothetical protein
VSASTAGRPPVHLGGPATRSPWAGVAILAVTNLLPLVLVLQGSLDLPLLVVCYLVEAVLVTLRAPAAPADPSRGGVLGRWDLLKGRLLFALGLVIFGAGAIAETRWDAGALLVLGVTVLLFLGGLRAAEGAPAPDGKRWLATWGWQLAVVSVGSLLAVPYVQDIGRLRAADWQPTALGDYFLAGAGVEVNTWMLGTGLEAEVLGTAIFVLFKTVNEVLMASRRAAAR